MPRKEARRKEKRKNESGQRAKPSTPTQAIDAHMGEEGKNQKTEGRTKERNREQAPNPATLTIRWEYSERGLCVGNTYFKHRSLHKYTRGARRNGGKEHDRSSAGEVGYYVQDVRVVRGMG